MKALSVEMAEKEGRFCWLVQRTFPVAKLRIRCSDQYHLHQMDAQRLGVPRHYDRQETYGLEAKSLKPSGKPGLAHGYAKNEKLEQLIMGANYCIVQIREELYSTDEPT